MAYSTFTASPIESNPETPGCFSQNFTQSYSMTYTKAHVSNSLHVGSYRNNKEAESPVLCLSMQRVISNDGDGKMPSQSQSQNTRLDLPAEFARQLCSLLIKMGYANNPYDGDVIQLSEENTNVDI
jgi:hypothetical protein